MEPLPELDRVETDAHAVMRMCRGAAAAAAVSGASPRPWEGAVGQYLPRRIFELARQQQLESFDVECAFVEVRGW